MTPPVLKGTLSLPAVDLPDTMLLDTSVAVPAFLPKLRRSGPPPHIALARTTSFVVALRAQSVSAFIASASLTELAHPILRRRFARDLLKDPSPPTTKPYSSWNRLYKEQPALVRHYAADIERLRRSIHAAELDILQPFELGPIASGRPFE